MPKFEFSEKLCVFDLAKIDFDAHSSQMLYRQIGRWCGQQF